MKVIAEESYHISCKYIDKTNLLQKPNTLKFTRNTHMEYIAIHIQFMYINYNKTYKRRY